MKNSLIASAVAIAATVGLTSAASACPHGYKRVTIQGNSVCMLDVQPNNNLKAPGNRGIDPVVAKPKLKVKR